MSRRPELTLWSVRGAAVLGTCLLGGAALTWWWTGRPIPPDVPDTVAVPELPATLQRDASLPLDATHTDVLVVAVCTLRADRMGVYGHPLPTTPFLDALADHGVVFEQHFTQAPWTRPAMGSLFTGRVPRVLKLDNPDEGKRFAAILHDDHTLLSELLGAHGYTALGAVANPNLKERFGFAQGFHEYSEPAGTYRERTYVPRADEVVDDMLEMVAGVPTDQRIYARVNVLDTHHPQRYALHYVPLFEDQAPHLTKYDAALRTIDAELARLVAELRKDRPNLLVMLAADHGEGLRLPGHHGPEHGNFVYRTTTQTPWLVFHPALPEPGRRIGGLSMNIDVLPTVADLLGLEAPPEVDGVSQADAILGTQSAASHSHVFAETFFRRRHLSMVYDGEHQLIREYSRPTVTGPYTDTMYTAADWQAHHDIHTAAPEAATALRTALSAWEADSELQSLASPDFVHDDVDASTDEMLRELGYVED